MEIIIENITWDFKPFGKWDDFDDILGISYVGIPANMMKRFIKECRWDDDSKVPPHYFEEDQDIFGTNTGGDGHDCYNTDTQIVLMNWLHDKRRKYKLEYRGADPFWIFHDHCHSQNDVHSYKVSGIGSWIEYTRIFEGAEMAKYHGIYIKPETVVGILNAWNDQFKWIENRLFQPISFSDFIPLMEDQEAIDYLNFLISI